MFICSKNAYNDVSSLDKQNTSRSKALEHKPIITMCIRRSSKTILSDQNYHQVTACDKSEKHWDCE